MTQTIKTIGNLQVKDFKVGMEAAVADMWNKSKESWPWWDFPVTPQYALDMIKSAACLDCFIVRDGEEAVGLMELKPDSKDKSCR